MNIVQLQYKLRDLPESTVKAAANGQVPDIPEMLATMELNRRARLENASSKPPTKSIKEQLEERLAAPPQEQMGLPGMLQQAQQATGEPQQEEVQQPGQAQQMPQQMAQAQPQGQPQQMRMGGVAGLPSGMFKQFYGGGIVAFDEGGDVDESAAETARLRRQEAMAVAREYMPEQSAPVAPPLPDDVARANQAIMQAPFVKQAAGAIEGLQSDVEVTTPQQEMERTKALLKEYGIGSPGTNELARVDKSREAYDKDRQERAFYQAMQAGADAARPNIYGRYMPGTIGKSVSGFGLANLEADRAFREANEKAEVTAKDANRAFELGNLNDAIKKSNESKAYKREANKIAATSYGQMAAHALTAQGTHLTNEESKRYHDMWEKIQDREIKAKYAQIAAQANQSIPEVMKLLDGIEKKFPEMMSKMTPEQKLEYVADRIAQTKGAESREAIVNAQLMEKRAEKIQEVARTDTGVLDAKKALTKARKNKSPIEEEEALAQLRRAMAAVEAGFPIPSIGNRGGISTLPQGESSSKNKQVYVGNTGKVIEPPSR